MTAETKNNGTPEEQDPFRFDEWAGKTRSDRESLLDGFRFDAEEIGALALESVEDLPPAYGARRVNRYIFAAPEASTEDRFMVKTYEFASALDAHRGLMDVVATYMAPWLPRCETKGLELGDIGFCGHDEPPSSVIFARNNILAEVRSIGLHMLRVADVAAELDRRLTAD